MALRHEDHKQIVFGSIQNMVSPARPIQLTDRCFLWAYTSLGTDGESLCVPKTEIYFIAAAAESAAA
jgi:hypothetical protein